MNKTNKFNLEHINFAYDQGSWVSIKWYRITDIKPVVYLDPEHVIDLPFKLL